jgi:sec-independent protein translocase protein TatB
MFNFSPEKLFLVAIIALVVLGPNRLPHAARSLGRFLAQLRHMSSSFQDEVRGALSEPMDAFNSAMGDFRPQDMPRSVRQAITSTLSPPPSSPSGASGASGASTPSPPTASSPAAPGSLPPSAASSPPVAGSPAPSPDSPVAGPGGMPVAPDDPSLN